MAYPPVAAARINWQRNVPSIQHPDCRNWRQNLRESLLGRGARCSPPSSSRSFPWGVFLSPFLSAAVSQLLTPTNPLKKTSLQIAVSDLALMEPVPACANGRSDFGLQIGTGGTGPFSSTNKIAVIRMRSRVKTKSLPTATPLLQPTQLLYAVELVRWSEYDFSSFKIMFGIVLLL